MPPAQHDAPIVSRLRAAGAVLIGRTNMTEFAFSGVGINPHYGTPGNPADRRCIPGGFHRLAATNCGPHRPAEYWVNTNAAVLHLAIDAYGAPSSGLTSSLMRRPPSIAPASRAGPRLSENGLTITAMPAADTTRHGAAIRPSEKIVSRRDDLADLDYRILLV